MSWPRFGAMSSTLRSRFAWILDEIPEEALQTPTNQIAQPRASPSSNELPYKAPRRPRDSIDSGYEIQVISPLNSFAKNDVQMADEDNYWNEEIFKDNKSDLSPQIYYVSSRGRRRSISNRPSLKKDPWCSSISKFETIFPNVYKSPWENNRKYITTLEEQEKLLKVFRKAEQVFEDEVDKISPSNLQWIKHSCGVSRSRAMKDGDQDRHKAKMEKLAERKLNDCMSIKTPRHSPKLLNVKPNNLRGKHQIKQPSQRMNIISSKSQRHSRSK